MSKLKDLVTRLTLETFATEEEMTLSVGKKQISLRPSISTLLQIDILADILDVSRQMMIDDILDQGISDAIDAYCEAHGPNHHEEAREGFLSMFTDRWEALNQEQIK